MSKQTLACFDIDGTLIQKSPWAVFLRSSRLDTQKRRLALPTIYLLVGLRHSKLLPEEVFRRWWVHLMATLLKGKTHSELKIIFEETVQTFLSGVVTRQDILDRLKKHQEQGLQILLASGLLEDFAKAFASHFGADHAVGTRLVFDHAGYCTGKILGEICVGNTKRAYVQAFVAENDADIQTNYADSASDIPFLELSQYPVATFPDKQLHLHALTNKWEIIQ
ncbi:MAG: HAD family hydrolase [Phototrophicaceae bacterium]